ncbi:MAG: hypothetical protein WA958_02210 [Tunicatimonas sp.]
MNRKQLTFFETTKPTANTPMSDMPERFQRVFAVLDGYREGRVSGEEIRALDSTEIDAAREWKEAWIEARTVAAFPDFYEEDGL